MKTLRSSFFVFLMILGASANASIITSDCASTTKCTLLELKNGGTIQVGDKLFYGWTASGLDNTNLNLIDVNGVGDGTKNPGLRFTNTLAAWFIANKNQAPDANLSMSFGYTVTVLDKYFIKDNELTIGPGSEGNNSGIGTSGGKISVTEFLSNGVTKFTSLTDQKFPYGPGNSDSSNLFDHKDFDPVKTLNVNTQVDLIAFGTANLDPPFSALDTRADLYSIEQRFSQTPEPASLALIVIGLAAMSFSLRRMRQSDVGS